MNELEYQIELLKRAREIATEQIENLQFQLRLKTMELELARQERELEKWKVLIPTEN